MKTKKQILSFLLAIFMIAPSILNIVHAESIEPNTNTAEDSYVSEQTIENTELLPQSGEESISSPSIIGEDVTKRDAFSKHYLRTDGTYIAITGAEAIHYQTDSGSWEEIDNSLVLDSSTGYYENSKSESGFDIAFSNDASKEEAVMIKDGENSISWYIEALRPNGSKNNASKSAKVKVKNNNANANARINGKGGKENSSISYSNIFGTDIGATLRYSVSENRIEEDIIFERVPEISAYTMNIKAPGMEATLNADGSVEIIAKNGKVAYTVKAPIMYDSDGVYSADIEVSVERHGNIIKVTYAPDMDWLRDESRAYPVTLDPIVETSQYTSNIVDVSVSEFSTTTFPGHLYLNVGYGMNGDSVTYIKFNNIPQFGYYLNINSAELILYTTDDSGDISDLELNYVTEAWSPNSISYNNLPDEYFVCDDMYIYCTQAENDIYVEEEDEYLSTLKYSFDIMDDIDSVTMGSSIDYYWDGYEGFSIRSSGDNYNFISSEHESFDHRPALVFSYSLSTPDFISNGAVYNIYNKMSGTYLSANNTSANVLEETTTELSANEYFKIIESVTSNGTFNGYKLGVMGQSSYALYGTSSQGVFGETAIAISSRYISSSFANNQDWLITHVYGNYYKISLRAWPELVLAAYDDGGVYYLNIETFDASDGQLWEIRSNGQTLNENMINVQKLHSDYFTYELTEDETVQLFCPVPTMNYTVSFVIYDQNIVSINASTYTLTANHAGTTYVNFNITDSTSEESQTYVNQFRVLIPNGIYSISDVDGNSLTVNSASTQNGASMDFAEYQSKYNQKWRIKHLGSGYYSIRPLYALNMTLQATSDAVWLQNSGSNDSISTLSEYAKWKIEYLNSGYTLKNISEDDGTVYLTQTSNGAEAAGFGCDEEYNQHFTLLNLNIPTGIVLLDYKEIMSKGSTYSAKAVFYTLSGSTIPSQTLTWSSSNTNIATVNSNGLISAVNSGEVTITVRSTTNVSNTFKIIITEPFYNNDEIFSLAYKINNNNSRTVQCSINNNFVTVSNLGASSVALEYWLFKKISGNLYNIYNLGKYDNSSSSSTYRKDGFALCAFTSGNNKVGVSVYNSTDESQQWYVLKVGDGFILKNKSNNMYLEYSTSLSSSILHYSDTFTNRSIFYGDYIDWTLEQYCYTNDNMNYIVDGDIVSTLNFKIVIDPSVFTFSSTVDDEEIVEYIEEAAMRWNGISENINIYPSNANNVENAIELLFRAGSKEFVSDSKTLARWYGTASTNGNFTSGEIVFNQNKPDVDWDNNIESIQGIIVHEIGHALGFKHINKQNTSLLDDDLEALSCMYENESDCMYYPTLIDKLYLIRKWGG